MREIKFRGQRLDNGKWAYGHYCWSMGKHYITEIVNEYPTHADPAGTYIENAYEVIGETVSQYIGLKDKNGKEMYEGDIIESDNGVKYVVSWVEQICGFYLTGIGTQRGKEFISCAASKSGNEPMLLFKDEIIGNIYENPTPPNTR